MKYFYDCEFTEGTQTCYNWGMKTDYWFRIFGIFFLMIAYILAYFFVLSLPVIIIQAVCYVIFVFFIGLSLPATPPTIDLISIGIVGEDNREYYAISKDFNLREAWNRYDEKEVTAYDADISYSTIDKVYWIRENVLRPIFEQLLDMHWTKQYMCPVSDDFTYKNLKKLISLYGKSRKDIANEVEEFCRIKREVYGDEFTGTITEKYHNEKIELYGYYSAYDHVALCWLFGKMINLPDGFPMYTRDLKQFMDEKANEIINRFCYESGNHTVWSLEQGVEWIKKDRKYPKQ